MNSFKPVTFMAWRRLHREGPVRAALGRAVPDAGAEIMEVLPLEDSKLVRERRRTCCKTEKPSRV